MGSGTQMPDQELHQRFAALIIGVEPANGAVTAYHGYAAINRRPGPMTA
jgi:hypothetical protein